MAAHSVTILVEMAGRDGWLDRSEVESYLFAMTHAPGFSELGPDDWDALERALRFYPQRPDAKYRQELHEMVLTILCHQLQEWEQLGKPAMHEEWEQAKYDARAIPTHHDLVEIGVLVPADRS